MAQGLIYAEKKLGKPLFLTNSNTNRVLTPDYAGNDVAKHV